MLKLPKRKKRDELQLEIDDLLDQMQHIEDTTGEAYLKLAQAVETLKKAQSYQKPRLINPDTVVVVVGNILVVAGVCLFEQTGHIIRTQSTRFLMKGRS